MKANRLLVITNYNKETQFYSLKEQAERWTLWWHKRLSLSSCAFFVQIATDYLV